MRHRGQAVVFEDIDDLASRIDDPELDVNESSVLVLRNAGPRGGPGMPEWGQLPIPQKLLRAGVEDMVRISDARMSGTAFGTNVLHVAPESAAGGPLGVVETGDPIELDVDARRLDLAIGAEELQRRLASGRHRRRGTTAATALSTSSTSCRPTRAATLTSCAVAARTRNRSPTGSCADG